MSLKVFKDASSLLGRNSSVEWPKNYKTVSVSDQMVVTQEILTEHQKLTLYIVVLTLQISSSYRDIDCAHTPLSWVGIE